jgi:hypothetical protein
VQQPQQPSIPPCPQCGGQRVGMECPSDMLLRRYNSASAAGIVSGMHALVCVNCGNVMLYADSLPKLHEELRKHPYDFKY